ALPPRFRRTGVLPPVRVDSRAGCDGPRLSVASVPLRESSMDFVVAAIAEDQPGPKWRALFERFWPAYERWFLSEGDKARPRYLTSLRQLRAHMPELVPTYEKLVELAGTSALIARFLSSFCPPSYHIACPQ